ncbi:hypothetical protein Micbo1qcDRAFT_204604 [Microdochium bolleyi]|uniref:Myb/SANT-like domain-containing protein n=1 Tax=Microdochium bolleyi TaxID=196109 RepID=A0A136J2M9_9PEZI|nr:hypothetical protein Micbo1qcDRAFT_204604 [Microdochium bolleyi]
MPRACKADGGGGGGFRWDTEQIMKLLVIMMHVQNPGLTISGWDNIEKALRVAFDGKVSLDAAKGQWKSIKKTYLAGGGEKVKDMLGGSASGGGPANAKAGVKGTKTGSGKAGRARGGKPPEDAADDIEPKEDDGGEEMMMGAGGGDSDDDALPTNDSGGDHTRQPKSKDKGKGKNPVNTEQLRVEIDDDDAADDHDHQDNQEEDEDEVEPQVKKKRSASAAGPSDRRATKKARSSGVATKAVPRGDPARDFDAFMTL